MKQMRLKFTQRRNIYCLRGSRRSTNKNSNIFFVTNILPDLLNFVVSAFSVDFIVSLYKTDCKFISVTNIKTSKMSYPFFHDLVVH